MVEKRKTGAGASRAPTAEKAATKAPAKRATAQKVQTKKTPAKKAAPAKKSVANKSTTKKTAPAKKAPVKKTAAKKTTATKTAPAAKTAAAAKKGTAAEKTAAKKTTTRKTSAEKAAAGAVAARKTAAAKPKQAARPAAAKKTGAKVLAKKKSTAVPATAPEPAPLPTARTAAQIGPGDFAVRPGEGPWTAEEVDALREGLLADVERLSSEITAAEVAVSGLMRDSGETAGEDDADTGSKNISREHEMALARNARETLTQTEHALERLDRADYGLCESCGNPIGKARLQAFPRATLCVECKQRQERR